MVETIISKTKEYPTKSSFDGGNPTPTPANLACYFAGDPINYSLPTKFRPKKNRNSHIGTTRKAKVRKDLPFASFPTWVIDAD